MLIKKLDFQNQEKKIEPTELLIANIDLPFKIKKGKKKERQN
jgi:hypothetical protein